MQEISEISEVKGTKYPPHPCPLLPGERTRERLKSRYCKIPTRYCSGLPVGRQALRGRIKKRRAKGALFFGLTKHTRLCTMKRKVILYAF